MTSLLLIRKLMRRCLFLAILWPLYSTVFAAEDVPPAAMDPGHKALLQEYCLDCHGPEKQKGKFRVDELSFALNDLQTAERWQKVLDAINSGEMPPEEEKQPPSKEKADFLDDLAHVMVSARRQLSDQHGVITLRRLNQRELKNTLIALLGAAVDVSDLPSDTDAGSFDTVGANLFMSGSQFEQYEAIGRNALEEGFALRAATGVPKKFRYEAEESLKTISDFVKEGLETHERGKKWVEAVQAAMARPENATVVAELRKTAKSDAIVRRSWEKIAGAPSPESFGFISTENTADKANRAYNSNPASFAYQSRYLELPALDTGAYLTIHDQDGGLNSAFILRIPGDFPPGDYVIRVRAAATPGSAPERRFLDFGFKGRKRPTTSVHEVTGTMASPEVIEIPFHRTLEHRDQNKNAVYIRERGTADSYEQIKFKQEQGRKLNGIGFEPAIWVDWIEIERVPDSEIAPGLRALEGIALDDKTRPPKAPELRAAFERFALEAFRGAQPSERFLDRLVGCYEESRADGSRHSIALREALALVLASPKFLYRAEPSPSEERRPLNGPEMATRLSYFLWGAPPDPTLRALGNSGELLKAQVLAAQAGRLLDDPRSMEFVKAFTRQWFNLSRLDFFEFNPELYPRFDYATKISAKNELFETFAHLLRVNGPVSDLLKADYVVINSALANYYGIEGIHGDAFRKVSLPRDSPRGGLLGMAAVLAMGSNGEHTSPVERGAWVLRKLMNDPPPPAPANVPALTRLAGKVLTTRDRVLAHQEEAQCASCHRKIDPIGFGLENFNAVGLWRTEDSYQVKDDEGKAVRDAKISWTIDPAGALHRGPAFASFLELREAIATKSEPFSRGLSAALIEYALGRPCGFSDEPLVDAMVAQARTKNYALREFIHALIRSEAFQRK